MEDLIEYDKLRSQKRSLESNLWQGSDEVRARKKEEIERIKELTKQMELKSEAVREYAEYCSLCHTRQSASSALIAYGQYLGCKDKEFAEEAQEAEDLEELYQWADKGIKQLLEKSEMLRNFIAMQSRNPKPIESSTPETEEAEETPETEEVEETPETGEAEETLETAETTQHSTGMYLLMIFCIVLPFIASVIFITYSRISQDNEIKEVEEFENLPAMTLDSTQNKEKVQSASDSIAVSYAARLLELRSAPIGLRTGAPTYIDLLEFSKEGTNPIVITKFFYTYTTGKGGPNMMFGFVNTSDKTIEHIEFECSFMDNPEEVMHGFARCFYDKPLKPNERTGNDYWVWVESGVLSRGLDGFFEEASRMARLNNESFRIARYIILGTVKITYTDGTTVYAYKEKSA